MANNTPLNRLYEKMFKEQQIFRQWLLRQRPEEILSHACEYATREDILMWLTENELSETQAKALLTSTTPLNDIYLEWLKAETNHMDDIGSIMARRANMVLQAEKKSKQQEVR